jgi:hypothetical protein
VRLSAEWGGILDLEVDADVTSGKDRVEKVGRDDVGSIVFWRLVECSG